MSVQSEERQNDVRTRSGQKRAALKEIARRSGRHTLYEVLQVSHYAEEAVIQAAYRALARANHPDVSADPSAPQRMQELNEAYEVLNDPRKRAMYDLNLGQQRNPDNLAEEEQQGIRRRTTCWRCDDPLEGAFARYCGDCHWIICEICRGCGCAHPNWRNIEQPKARRRVWVAAVGWVLAALFAIGWLVTVLVGFGLRS